MIEARPQPTGSISTRGTRAVASMYSWGGGGGGVGQKFPNDEKNFRIFNGIRRHEGVCYPENEDAICKQKYAYIKHKGRRPEEIFKFRVFEMPFPGLWGRFDRILMVRKQRFSMSKFTICLQFSSTKCAKAYLINYILGKLQENMGNMILCSLSWIM